MMVRSVPGFLLMLDNINSVVLNRKDTQWCVEAGAQDRLSNGHSFGPWSIGGKYVRGCEGNTSIATHLVQAWLKVETSAGRDRNT